MAILNLATTTVSKSLSPKPNIPFLAFHSNASLSFIPYTPHQQIKSRRTDTLRTFDGNNSSKRGGDERETIMLPGCDYNHWLIVMEFPKDHPPTREQMIDTYLDTLA